MDTKKLLVGTAAAAVLAVGGATAVAAGPNTTAEKQDATAQQERGPSYTGSIKAPAEGQGEDEGGAESQKPQGLAKIDQTAAEQAALKAAPGTARETDLQSENGFVVYGVEVAGNDGKTHDVKVDAGNGRVLHQQVDGSEPGDASETGESAD